MAAAKPVAAKRRKPSKPPAPTERTLLFVEGMRKGLIQTQAAQAAGYANPATEAKRLMKDPWVASQVSEVREENRQMNLMTREKVSEGIMDAIAMARLMADPTAMIRGYQEINKMNGFYAPEKKEISIMGKQRRLQTQYENMSDTELLEKLGEEVIEGVFEEVMDDDEDTD